MPNAHHAADQFAKQFHPLVQKKQWAQVSWWICFASGVRSFHGSTPDMFSDRHLDSRTFLPHYADKNSTLNPRNDTAYEIDQSLTASQVYNTVERSNHSLINISDKAGRFGYVRALTGGPSSNTYSTAI